MNLESSIRECKGVGEKTQALFANLGVYSVSDMLLHFPRDYVQYPPIAEQGMFEVDSLCAIRGKVVGKPYVHKGRISVTSCNVFDGYFRYRMTWFRMPYLAKQLKEGEEFVFFGKVQGKQGQFVMEQPRMFSCKDYVTMQENMQPVYGLTGGLKNQIVCKAISDILAHGIVPKEILPEEILKKMQLPTQSEAYAQIHFPTNKEQYENARRKIAFEELFLFVLGLKYQKNHLASVPNNYPVKDYAIEEAVRAALSYDLTAGQTQTISEIKRDLSGAHSMQRMVQGDVGSGKTIVAFLTMLFLAQNGYQAAMMAPTEVLAKQHFAALSDLVSRLGLSVPVVLLTGSTKGAQRKAVYDLLAREAPVLAVGTHALFQEKVSYGCLGLVITDEQHRFGVRQREAFSEKGKVPHVLVMSATPIPRTLGMILYGDLDVSIMEGAPAKRLPIKNCVVGPDYRMTAYRMIYKEVTDGHQAYVICSLVSASEEIKAQDTETYTETLRATLPEGVTIACLHGQMKADEKNRIMEAFHDGKIQVLVSTTVIEVGVDVPNATVILIEDAQRFGLAQLHQLRGRVGRSDLQSYCILMNTSDQPKAAERLEVLNHSNDGFFIAEEDLRLRGPGDYFGVRQSGDMVFRVADIYRDKDLLVKAASFVEEILAEDPELTAPAHAVLKQRVTHLLDAQSFA